MRIISGKYKSKKINTLKSSDTRPTSDKVRESIFSMLGVVEGDVLDLFGGTGALAIEAISRGGTSAMIIDGAKDAIRIIRENTDSIEEPIEIYRNDYRRALKAMSKREKSFNLIFLDPPYRKKLVDKSLEIIKSESLLKPNGRIVVETSADETVNIDGFKQIKTHTYGTMKVQLLELDNH
ncbi:16S rRNA (guanine(966)-N(2))-methyltransferase RsmD [Jeotgalicoccus sp. ATCC 8456]|uniref:16S rRNA (guanine(966)-N(2))-methyltransferase RsmD n=1 Tax=Jeotgalicoccus sp. ATCC 8456 TaxID=946435 RepID=UPI0018E5EE43|nr:16S rRNA (guanine(966)-N(2))-methyltransferase RsmD [Jeotgalicoccus sp. ATCC 8456]QQD85803.1 16S rRNA (guanine(966)-N(2))-methyltransferase RsmD [Jeotgalicoccus sp. ATCC 8456]